MSTVPGCRATQIASGWRRLSSIEAVLTNWLSAGDKVTFAMLLSYAWQNDYCFPGQERLATDMGLDQRSVRRHLKSLQTTGLLAIQRRGQGKTNIYELNLKPRRI